MAAATDVQMVRRLGASTEIAEEYVRHVGVIMLAGVRKTGRLSNVAGQFLVRWRRFHEKFGRAATMMNGQRHC